MRRMRGSCDGLGCGSPRSAWPCFACSAAHASHREVVDQLRGTDRVSIFRTLISLVDAKLARRLELGDHTWRFELVDAGEDEGLRGTFSCIRCMTVTRFEPITITVGPGVSEAVRAGLGDGEVQVRGVCGTCR